MNNKFNDDGKGIWCNHKDGYYHKCKFEERQATTQIMNDIIDDNLKLVEGWEVSEKEKNGAFTFAMIIRQELKKQIEVSP